MVFCITFVFQKRGLVSWEDHVQDFLIFSFPCCFSILRNLPFSVLFSILCHFLEYIPLSLYISPIYCSHSFVGLPLTLLSPDQTPNKVFVLVSSDYSIIIRLQQHFKYIFFISFTTKQIVFLILPFLRVPSNICRYFISEAVALLLNLT